MANQTLLVGDQWTQRWARTSLYYPNQIVALVLVGCAFPKSNLLKITRHARRVAWRELSILGHCDHRCRYIHFCHVRIHRPGHLSLCVVRPHIAGDGLLDMVWIWHGLHHGSVLCMLICRLHCWCVCMFVTFHRWFNIGLDLWLPSIGFACIVMTQLIVRSWIDNVKCWFCVSIFHDDRIGNDVPM